MSESILLPESPYFRLEQVAEGVYAALVREGTGALGNAGIVDLGGETLVFDTFLIPRAAQDLRRAAEYLTGHRVRFVVNSHWHRDHVFGNQEFRDAEIISTTRTRELLEEVGPKQLAAVSEFAEAVRMEEEALSRETDERRRNWMSRELADDRAFLAAMPDVVLTLPTLTFDEHLTIHGTRRTVVLASHGLAHTESDAYLLLPDEGIAFVGDLVMGCHHPWLGHGNPEAWLDTLNRLRALNLKQIVSGHGPVGPDADIAMVEEYISDVTTLLRGLVSRGVTREQALQTAIPYRWAEWGLPEVFTWNVNALYTRFTAEGSRP